MSPANEQRCNRQTEFDLQSIHFRLLELLDEGAGFEMIATEMEIPAVTIPERIRQLGLDHVYMTPSNRGAHWSPSEETYLLTAVTQRILVKEVAAHLERTPRAIQLRIESLRARGLL